MKKKTKVFKFKKIKKEVTLFKNRRKANKQVETLDSLLSSISNRDSIVQLSSSFDRNLDKLAMDKVVVLEKINSNTYFGSKLDFLKKDLKDLCIEIKNLSRVSKNLKNIIPVLLEDLFEEENPPPLTVSEKQRYRYLARFKINAQNVSSIKGYELLQKVGYYNKFSNPNGVVKDHRFSIKSGISMRIPPEFLGNLNNCEFILYKDNLIKSSDNSLSFENFCYLTGYSCKHFREVSCKEDKGSAEYFIKAHCE